MENRMSQPASSDHPDGAAMMIAHRRVSSLLDGALSAHKVDPQLIQHAQERIYSAFQEAHAGEQQESTLTGLKGLFLETVLQPKFLQDERTWGLIGDIGKQPIYNTAMADALVEAVKRHPNHAEQIIDCLILVSPEKACAVRQERREEQQIALQREIRSKLPPLTAVNPQY
jgi:hypothetical protein